MFYKSAHRWRVCDLPVHFAKETFSLQYTLETFTGQKSTRLIQKTEKTAKAQQTEAAHVAQLYDQQRERKK